MKKLGFSSAVALTVFCAAVAAPVMAQWTPVLIGNTGGFFPDGTIDAPFRIVADPVDPDVIYMGTGVIPTPGEAPPPADGLWKSVNGGNSWTQINEPSTGDPNLDFFEFTSDTSLLDLAICPGNRDVLAVATNPKGFFRSTDGGSTWSWVAGGIVHTDNDSAHCGAVSHADQTFDSVDGRWAASTVTFDPSDASCNTMYGGIGDINSIDIGAGTGDHPGVFKTIDGGSTWSELNGNLGPLFDAIDCHSLDLESKTIAPISIKGLSDGSVVLGVTEQHLDASLLASKNATTQSRVFSNTGSGNWTEVSNGLSSTAVTQTAGLFDAAAVSLSVTFLTLPATQTFFVASHLGLAAITDTGGDGDFEYESEGIYGSIDLSVWAQRSTGLPRVNDALNENSINTGVAAVRPTAPGIWLTGTFLADGVGADGSQVYGTLDFGGIWRNTGAAPAIFPGLSTSPSGGWNESSVFFVEWDAIGACLYASVLWDFRNDLSTPDDGLYKVCT